MINNLFYLTAERAVSLSIILVSIGAVIQALEYLLTRKHPVLGGLNDWSILRTADRGMLEAPLRYVTDALFSQTGFAGLNIIVFFCALALLIYPNSVSTKWLLMVVALCRGLLCFRKRMDLSAADQMQLMVFIGCMIYNFAVTSLVKTATLWLVSLEVVLIYVAAGVIKAVTPLWRNGNVLASLLRTRAWSTPEVYRLTRSYPWLAAFAAGGTIVFECLLPLCVFAGPLPCLVFIIFGTIFHANNVYVMGLNDFLWAFPGSYPLLLYFSIDFQQKVSAIF